MKMKVWDWVCKNCRNKQETVVGQQHIKCKVCGFEEIIKWKRLVRCGD